MCVGYDTQYWPRDGCDKEVNSVYIPRLPRTWKVVNRKINMLLLSKDQMTPKIPSKYLQSQNYFNNNTQRVYFPFLVSFSPKHTAK